MLAFTIGRNGQVLSYSLQQGTGHPLLDREVEAMIRRAQPLPPIPDSISGTALSLVVPVRFALR